MTVVIVDTSPYLEWEGTLFVGEDTVKQMKPRVRKGSYNLMKVDTYYIFDIGHERFRDGSRNFIVVEIDHDTEEDKVVKTITKWNEFAQRSYLDYESTMGKATNLEEVKRQMKFGGAIMAWMTRPPFGEYEIVEAPDVEQI